MRGRRNLGRRDPGPFPLLPKCPECGHHIPNNEEYPELIAHWPRCSMAEQWQRDIWERRSSFRQLRSIRRIEIVDVEEGKL